MGSSISSASGLTSQRKMIYTYTSGYWTLHTVYESGGEIWYTKSTNNGSTWSAEMRLSRGSGTAHNPSISEVYELSTYGYVVWVDVTNRPGATGYDINARKFNLSTGAWSATESVSSPYGNYVGYAAQNAHPVAVSWVQNADQPWVDIAYESSSGRIFHSYFAYSELWDDRYVWIHDDVDYTSGCVNPSITMYGNNLTLTMNTSSNLYIAQGSLVSWQENPHAYFNSASVVPTEGSPLCQFGNSVVDIDGSGRTHITWTAFNYDYWCPVVLYISKDYYGNWAPLTEFRDDLVEYPVLTTSVSGDYLAGGATMLWSNGSVFINSVSTDGVNFSTNSLTSSPSSNFPNTIAKSASLARTLYTQNTSAPYRLQYQVWNNTNRLSKGTTQASTEATRPVEKRYRRMALVNPDDGSSLRLQFGNVSMQTGTTSTPLTFDKVSAKDGKASKDVFLQSSAFPLSAAQRILADVTVKSKGWKLGGRAIVELADAHTGDLLANLGSFDCGTGNAVSDSVRLSQHLSTNSPGRKALLRFSIAGLDRSKLKTQYVNVIRVSSAAVLAKGESQDNKEVVTELPKDFGLLQNYPNPFNPTTAITYQLPVGSTVKLAIYDIGGRQVAELVNGMVEAGYHIVSFDGSHLSSGTYICRIEAISVENTAKQFMDVKKIVLLK